MRKQVKLSLLVFASGALLEAASGTSYNSSKTFLTIRPVFQSHMPEKEAGWRDRPLARDCGWGGAFQIVPLGGRSTHAKNIAEYFMFCDKSELVVAEDSALGSSGDAFDANPNFRDVNATHFNIQTFNRNFKSTIQFRPKHSFAGVGLDWRQYLHRRDACEKKWWFEVSTPLLWVHNDVKLTEVITATVLQYIDGANENMVEAFKGLKPFVRPNRLTVAAAPNLTSVVTGSGWQYGKIDGAQKRFRAADVEIKLGYDYICDEMCHAEGYIGGVIPAGNKPKSIYVFEPIVGHNFHGGIMWGGSWGWELWSSCDRYLHMEWAANARYLIKNTQVRSLDVKGKPWSRYMLVYRSFEDMNSRAAQEGINVFTRKVEVRPRLVKDFNTALVYTSCNFQGEIGYNYWSRESEEIKLDAPFETGITFVTLNQDGDVTALAPGNLDLTVHASVNRAITIKENFVGAEQVPTTATLYNQLALTEEDLSFESASSPCAISHTFYGSLGYRWDDLCYPVFVNLGGSYELASEKGAISRWLVWGKFGVSI